MTLEAIKYRRGSLEILDQLLLPAQSIYVKINKVVDAWLAIKNMQVRGAPAIAIVGCLSLAVELEKQHDLFENKQKLAEFIAEKLKYLITARPTAINMKNEAQKMINLTENLCLDQTKDLETMKFTIIDALEAIFRDDVATNIRLSELGAEEILKRRVSQNGDNGSVSVLTHCNTGSLATAGYGTALGVIRKLAKDDQIKMVYCTETRPYNQGARLTAFELVYERIPATLICDDMVGWLMKSKKIDAVVTGADRVALNGDVANKIGTYSIAVLAAYHKIPFYVASPISTFHPDTASGDQICIEERPHNEMTHINGYRLAADGIQCWNPAFDITPSDLITGIITEKGVLAPKDLKSAFENDWKL